LMPGLWDCHVHFSGRADPNIENMALLPLALAGVRAARDIAATLNAGYTSVREVGGNGAELIKAIDEGWVPGPNIYPSVAPLSQTAGHADLHTFPSEWLQDRIKHGFPFWICDGIDECRKAVRTQIRRGAKLIKVHATGGVMSRLDSPLAPQFSIPELKVIVEEATKAGLIVAAHCHAKAGIMNSLEAGVKTIEHGSYLDEEAISKMKEKDAILVATRAVFESGLAHPGNMPPESYKKMVQVAGIHKIAYETAVSSTDFPTRRKLKPHTRLRQE
jgi:imidazolonepropionase-like amidohydrolase